MPFRKYISNLLDLASDCNNRYSSYMHKHR